MNEEPCTLFKLELYMASEKRNRNVLLSWKKPLPLFSLKFTQGLPTQRECPTNFIFFLKNSIKD